MIALIESIKVVATATALLVLSVLGFATIVAFVLMLSWKDKLCIKFQM